MLRTTNSELKTKYNKGFTLIEIIVLIVLVGILLPAIIVPFATGIKGSGKPEMVNKAMFLAQQRMEELMKYVYGNAALNVTGVGTFVAFATGVPNYSGDNEIVYVPNNNLIAAGQAAPDTNYKRIHVRVTDPENTTYDVYSVVTNFP
jgi:prepilin-type N-terminal cleavage/methylation domain-containing protein